MNKTTTTIGANYDFASEISSRASDLESKNLKNYQNFGNYRIHGNQNHYNVLTTVDQPNKPLVPQNKFYTNREQRAFSFYQEHNTQSQIEATVQNYYHDPKRYSKAYRKEKSVAKPWFNNGDLATATDFVKNRQKSLGRVSVG